MIGEPKYFDDTKQRLLERAERTRTTREKRKRKQEEDGNMEAAKRHCTGLPLVKVEESQPILTDREQASAEDSQGPSTSIKATPSTTRAHKKQIVEDVMDRFINASLRQPPANTCCRVTANEFFANPEDLKGEIRLSHLHNTSVLKTLYIEGDEEYCCPRCCPPPVDPSACCNACNPALGDFLKDMESPPPAARAARTTTLTQKDREEWGDKDQALREALKSWREKAAELEWGPNHFIGGFGILPNDHVDRLVRLSRRGVLANVVDLQRELRWHFHSQYGSQVLEVIHSIYPHIDTPPVTPNHKRNPPNPPSLRSASTAPEPTMAEAQDPLPPANPASRPTRTITCGACGVKGHNGTPFFTSSFKFNANLSMLQLAVQIAQCDAGRLLPKAS